MAPRSQEPILELVNIHKAFGERQILKGVSFKVYAGEMLGLIGPSGCGKSTILKIICGLLEPDQGEVIKRSDEIGLVFQGSALLNSLSVRDNLAIALERRKLSRKEEDKIISEKLSMVGLAGFEDYSPTKLSGGQQKRTSFARAIVNDPKIILYDEPTTGLDPVMSTIIEDYMIELEHQLQAASIVVTHQHSTWTRTADRVLLMHAGKIVWEGSPEEGVSSEDPYMKQFAHATREGPMLAGAVED
ncbi:MAG: ATP-binding cassette domain-containing protein [Candidatus Obscuribacterales bacterium]|nr:ATP-binding cassette domain-containing protein [Candidatus Obscuribacterales bacterium]